VYYDKFGERSVGLHEIVFEPGATEEGEGNGFVVFVAEEEGEENGFNCIIGK
jgi:hypothetical protein